MRAGLAWALSVVVTGLALGPITPVARAAPSSYVFPLRLHLGPRADADRTWISAQIDQANRLYLPFQISFARQQVQPLPTPLYVIELPRELHTPEQYLDERYIDVFVVDSLDDRDERDEGELLGITTRGRRIRRFVAIEADQVDYVLAHELGHYFGLEHSAERSNLMTRSWHRGPMQLTAAQGAVVARTAAELTRTHRPSPLRTP